ARAAAHVQDALPLLDVEQLEHRADGRRLGARRAVTEVDRGVDLGLMTHLLRQVVRAHGRAHGLRHRLVIRHPSTVGRGSLPRDRADAGFGSSPTGRAPHTRPCPQVPLTLTTWRSVWRTRTR